MAISQIGYLEAKQFGWRLEASNSMYGVLPSALCFRRSSPWSKNSTVWAFCFSLASFSQSLAPVRFGGYIYLSTRNEGIQPGGDNSTRGSDLPGKCFIRSLFWYLSERTEPAWRAAVYSLEGNSSGGRSHARSLRNNPNASNRRNGAGATNPFRLSPAEAATADQDHGYRAEQLAFDAGAMDLFPRSVGAADRPGPGRGIAATTGLTMGYYDGNVVTALWNYAQRYAMSDRFFGTTFGPSVLGAINLISGQTNGVINDSNASGAMVSDGSGGYTLFSNAYPTDEVCVENSGLVHMRGRNIGDMLNAAGVTWGFFAEGFDTTITNSNGTSGCNRSHTSSITKQTSLDYIPYLDPFQYYASTRNPVHARPTAVSKIGHSNDGTHHQYDLHDFFDAVEAGNFPAVSFIKAAGYRDGHAGYSDPIDEQSYLVTVINTIEQTQEWHNTVIIVTYDDSDGWYDHVNHVINGSETSEDDYSSRRRCLDGGVHCLECMRALCMPRAGVVMARASHS